MIAGAVAVLILVALGGLHVFWAAGGKAGKKAAIPTLGGQPVLKPGALGTAGVAIVLFAMAVLLAVRIGLLSSPSSLWLTNLVRVGSWLVAGVFALWAIGDFHYVGFFKSVRDSRFARFDTMLYSPFCAVLALLIGIACTEP